MTYYHSSLMKRCLELKLKYKAKKLGVIFDSTTHVCEAFTIVIQFVSDSWSIEQRLIKIQLLAKCLTAEEVACKLISILSTQFSISSNSIVAAMSNWASVNNAAMRTLKIVYPVLLDVGCFSHTLNHTLSFQICLIFLILGCCFSHIVLKLISCRRSKLENPWPHIATQGDGASGR